MAVRGNLKSDEWAKIARPRAPVDKLRSFFKSNTGARNALAKVCNDRYQHLQCPQRNQKQPRSLLFKMKFNNFNDENENENENENERGHFGHLVDVTAGFPWINGSSRSASDER